MTKGGKIALGVVSVLAVAGVGYLVYSVLRKPTGGGYLGEDEGDTPIIGETKPPCARAVIFPMGDGSKGAQVKAIQKYLNKVKRFPLVINLKEDCVWGRKTQAHFDIVSKYDSIMKERLAKAVQSQKGLNTLTTISRWT